MGEPSDNPTSRRDFLKKSLKVVGYSVPAMMALSTVSLDAFARKYNGSNNVIVSNKYNIGRIRRYIKSHPNQSEQMLKYLKKYYSNLYNKLYK